MKQYLYHVTDMGNVDSILRDGLQARNGFCCYLCENPKSWWVRGNAVVRVRITGLRGEKLRTFGDPKLDEVLYFGDIPAGRISRWRIPRSWYHPEWMCNKKKKEAMPCG